MRTVLRNEGPSFILDHFDVFFSVLVHGSNLKLPVHVSAFERIYNCLEMLVEDLEPKFNQNTEPDKEEKPSLVSIHKMLAYLLCSFVRLIEVAVAEDADGTQGKVCILLFHRLSSLSFSFRVLFVCPPLLAAQKNSKIRLRPKMVRTYG